jgi:glycosyltransferase involved in cell wall biosynthesis/phospholipid N-methyltransferase
MQPNAASDLRPALDEPAPKLSAIVPVYNERYLIAELLHRLAAAEIPSIRELEIIVVDDGSTDGSPEIVRRLIGQIDRLQLIEQPRNRGKGAAIRAGIDAARGDLIVFQDADLEYDPRDLERLVKPFLEDGADAVYGSRFQFSGRRRVLYYRHELGNRLITTLSNLFTDLNLSDVETCYKMFRAPLLKSIPLRSNDFAMEVEITAKIAKRQFRVFEVPISYSGRTYQEGKKITWRDGFKALAAILRYWLLDDLYKEDAYGSHLLHSLERTHRFTRWLAASIGPRVGERVLEIGAGIGTTSMQLVPRELYVAGETNPDHRHYLENLARGKPYMTVAHLDAEDGRSFSRLDESFDTVVCLNILERVADPVATLRNIASVLQPQGRLLLYVPQKQSRYSSLDEALGRRCRYDRRQLERELTEAGLKLAAHRDFNRAGVVGWWWNGKLLRRRRFSRWQLKLFDLAVPLLRRVDRLLPWRGLGLIAVACRAGSVEEASAD